jgi:hypothetical protein
MSVMSVCETKIPSGLAMAALVLYLINPCAAQHQEATRYDDPSLDILPRGYAPQRHNAKSNETGVFRAFRLWPSDTRLIICFLGGSVNIRTRIASIAREWLHEGAALTFDFGSPPRTCDSKIFAHIRIGFDAPGYWSLTGSDSVEIDQAKRSMNLAGLDNEVFEKGSVDRQFRRHVLHEFGHALGLGHEHQHPSSDCEGEYDWPAIYKFLGGAPNYWSKENTDYQMRRLVGLDIRTSNFDPKSVMLYAFPPFYFKQGEKSPCFTNLNIDLSTGDYKLLRRMYPPSATDSVARIPKTPLPSSTDQ